MSLMFKCSCEIVLYSVPMGIPYILRRYICGYICLGIICICVFVVSVGPHLCVCIVCVWVYVFCRTCMYHLCGNIMFVCDM